MKFSLALSFLVALFAVTAQAAVLGPNAARMAHGLPPLRPRNLHNSQTNGKFSSLSYNPVSVLYSRSRKRRFHPLRIPFYRPSFSATLAYDNMPYLQLPPTTGRRECPVAPRALPTSSAARLLARTASHTLRTWLALAVPSSAVPTLARRAARSRAHLRAGASFLCASMKTLELTSVIMQLRYQGLLLEQPPERPPRDRLRPEYVPSQIPYL